MVRPTSGFISPGNLRTTTSDNETLQPAGNGWSIANLARYQQANWLDEPGSHTMKVKIEALGHPSLTGSSTSTTGGTLAIALHTGSWHYKANTGPHTTCQGPVSTKTVTLSGLTAGTSYTYTAYSDSGCATPLASASFTTLSPSLTASNVTKTTARLTVGNHTGQWWYQADVAPHTTCQGPVAAGTASKDLTGPHLQHDVHLQGVQCDGVARARTCWRRPAGVSPRRPAIRKT